MTGKTISIHQPNYLPYLGFFDKIKNSDTFVILDNVQFVRTGEFAWQHRNRIRSKGGWLWLTIPVVRDFKSKIKDVKIANQNWQEEHWKSIEFNYRRTLYWDEYSSGLSEFYKKDYDLLVDINIPLIKWFMEKFGLKSEIILVSDLNLDENLQSTDLLLEIVKRLDGGIYLSGKMGETYLDKGKFQNNGIEIIFQNFHHPIYKQKYPEFIPNLSAIDSLFNAGITL